MKQNKSAKDIAFDKERIKFRSEIRNLMNCLNDKQRQINELNEIVKEEEEIIRQQKEWIDRLLDYTEMSKEDIKTLVESEKEKAEIRERVSTTLGILGIIGERNYR